jgi:hypothetical protein
MDDIFQGITTPHRSILLASNQQLQDRAYYRRLWQAIRGVKLSRRAWRDTLADMLRDYRGDILYAPGVPYQIPLVDHVFGDDEDMRWMGYYLKADKSGDHPLMHSQQFERLRLLDLYARIHQLIAL